MNSENQSLQVIRPFLPSIRLNLETDLNNLRIKGYNQTSRLLVQQGLLSLKGTSNDLKSLKYIPKAIISTHSVYIDSIKMGYKVLRRVRNHVEFTNRAINSHHTFGGEQMFFPEVKPPLQVEVTFEEVMFNDFDEPAELPQIFNNKNKRLDLKSLPKEPKQNIWVKEVTIEEEKKAELFNNIKEKSEEEKKKEKEEKAKKLAEKEKKEKARKKKQEAGGLFGGGRRGLFNAHHGYFGDLEIVPLQLKWDDGKFIPGSLFLTRLADKIKKPRTIKTEAAEKEEAQETTGSLFGSGKGKAPQISQSGGLFGSARPTSGSGGGLFGKSSGGGLFGSTTQAQPLSSGGGLFGTGAQLPSSQKDEQKEKDEAIQKIHNFREKAIAFRSCFAPSLRKLAVQSYNFTEDCCPYIFSALRCLSNLREFTFQLGPINTSGGGLFGSQSQKSIPVKSLFDSKPFVKQLDLSITSVIWYQQFTEASAKRMTALKTISLTEQVAYDMGESLTIMNEFLESVPSLKHLSLHLMGDEKDINYQFHILNERFQTLAPILETLYIKPEAITLKPINYERFNETLQEMKSLKKLKFTPICEVEDEVEENETAILDFSQHKDIEELEVGPFGKSQRTGGLFGGPAFTVPPKLVESYLLQYERLTNLKSLNVPLAFSDEKSMLNFLTIVSKFTNLQKLTVFSKKEGCTFRPNSFAENNIEFEVPTKSSLESIELMWMVTNDERGNESIFRFIAAHKNTLKTLKLNINITGNHAGDTEMIMRPLANLKKLESFSLYTKAMDFFNQHAVVSIRKMIENNINTLTKFEFTGVQAGGLFGGGGGFFGGGNQLPHLQLEDAHIEMFNAMSKSKCLKTLTLMAAFFGQANEVIEAFGQALAKINSIAYLTLMMSCFMEQPGQQLTRQEQCKIMTKYIGQMKGLRSIFLGYDRHQMDSNITVKRIIKDTFMKMDNLEFFYGGNVNHYHNYQHNYPKVRAFSDNRRS